MTLQDWGAIGELLGGIAVVASVLYLAIQIRHGLQGYQSNITQQITSHFSLLQLEIAKDAGLFTAWTKAQRGEPLSEDESARVLQIVSSYLIGFENMYYQYRQGMLEENAWRARRNVIANLIKIPGTDAWWSEFGTRQFPADFVQEVESIKREFTD